MWYNLWEFVKALEVWNLKGLVIKSPYIEDILNGIKTWEVRGSNTNIQGRIVLLKSGSGMALGTVEIYDSIEIDLDEYNTWDYRIRNNKALANKLPYKRTFKWLLKNPIWYDKMKPYTPPFRCNNMG